MARAFVRLLLAVALFAAGVFVGASWGWRNLYPVNNTLVREFTVSATGLYASTQYFLGKDQAAQDALQKYLAIMEEMHNEQVLTGPAYGFDTTVALVRLGNVRLRAGDQVGAHQYFEQAVKRCAEAGWKGDCSEDRVRSVVEMIDKSALAYQLVHPSSPPSPSISASPTDTPAAT